MPDMKTAAVIRHAGFLDLAAFGDVLKAKGFQVRYYDAGLDDLSMDAESDVLITLGGPMGAYERSGYPWIDDEMGLLYRHLNSDRPFLLSAWERKSSPNRWGRVSPRRHRKSAGLRLN